MSKYLIFLLALLCCSCHETKRENDSAIQVFVLRGPSLIALADWIANPPTIDNHPIKVTIIDSPDRAQASIIKGESDITVLPMINAANLYNKGIAIRLAGCPIWGTLYLVERQTICDSALYVFGGSTTPDILLRYYLQRQQLDYPLKYTFTTAQEVTHALLAKKADRSVLCEPFLSIALRKDSTLKILTNLNHTTNEKRAGFAQTAIIYTPRLEKYRTAFEQALRASCIKATQQPEQTIHFLESQGLFPKNTLTTESIKRCEIRYLSTKEAAQSILEFLKLIEQYEPKAIGGKLPDNGFINPQS